MPLRTSEMYFGVIVLHNLVLWIWRSDSARYICPKISRNSQKTFHKILVLRKENLENKEARAVLGVSKKLGRSR